jgi:hypothetical protein
MNGGMSHLDTFDPKKDAEVKGKFNSINTNADYSISEHLPKLAKHGDKMALIRSMMVNTGAHEQAQYLQRTSYKKIGTIVHPNMGAWMCRMQDNEEKINIPQNVLIGGPADHPGAGWMAKKYSPIPIQDPLRGLENAKIKNKDEFSKRIEILKKIERDAMKAANPSEKSYAEFYDQTVRLLNSSELDVFDLTKESAEKREKYGNNRFGQGVCLAKRLVEQGGCKFIEVSDGGWDTHVNNFDALEDKLKKTPYFNTNKSIIDKWITEYDIQDIDFPFLENKEIKKLISMSVNFHHITDEDRILMEEIQIDFYHYAAMIEADIIIDFLKTKRPISEKPIDKKEVDNESETPNQLSVNQAIILLDKLGLFSSTMFENLPNTRKAKLISQLIGKNDKNIKTAIEKLELKPSEITPNYQKDIDKIERILNNLE